MFKSFAFMPRDIDASFYYEVWEEVQRLRWYFYKFARDNADEAMQRALMHTLTHFNPNGNLTAYIKKLAREIHKGGKKKHILVDFLEQTLAEEDEYNETQAKVDTGRISDFSSELIKNIDGQESKYQDVVEVALEFMDKFILLCEALIHRDTTTTYYPEPFIKECLRISSKCDNFNSLCINLYRNFEDDFRWFLDLDNDNVGQWKETDYLLINQSRSKRVKLINTETGQEVEDADLEDWKISGSLGSGTNKKRVIKVYYSDIWDTMCDLVDDTETNQMKFIIDDTYIIRTLGGSFSVINPDLYNIYDLIRMEILTNVLQDTYGRVLNVGSDAIYLLCSPAYKIKTGERIIREIPINFEFIDITDSI